MKLIKRRKIDFEETIKYCYENDPTMRVFGRSLEDNINSLKNADPSFKFYEIFNDDSFVGYFGIERSPVQFLTTFFIMPEYRKDKKKVLKFIKQHLPKTFFTGLFKMNTRAINFFEKNGGKPIADIVWENQPAVIFKFER